jgi:CRP/FNR family transcriptional regulator, dissimilatory nitrate respiration regulator
MNRLLRRVATQSLPPVFEQSGLLNGVPESVADTVLQHSSVRQLQSGTVLFLQDQDASAVYLIESGWIKLFRETVNGDEAVLDVLTTGHFIGTLGDGSTERHSDSAAALTLVRLYTIPTPILVRLMRECPQLAINMLMIQQKERHQQSMELEHERLQTAPQRLGCFLLRLCEPVASREDVRLTLPIDKSLIARRLGMKPETFSRALGALKSEVGLQVEGATLTIPDVSRLSSAVCGACSATTPCVE